MFTSKKQRGRQITKTQNNRFLHRSTSNNANREINTSKEKTKNWEYSKHHILGRGTFGIVFYATLLVNKMEVAVKKVLQDSNYKNRELDILKELEHPNIVKLYHWSFAKQPREADNQEQKSSTEEIYLYLIMEYVPEDLSKIIRYFHKTQKKAFPNILIKLYSYQLFRALAYLKYCGVCHRDIKPRNILINPKTNEMKICDFGSAKKLIKGSPNLAYVCSRYYRAPELAFGNTNYDLKSDIWSAGCVLAQMYLGQPVFFGETTVDHLAKIFSILGTPNEKQIYLLNPDTKVVCNFPKFKTKKWSKVLPKADPMLTDILQKVLRYIPEERADPFQLLLHPYYDELKTCKINGIQPNFLFNFSEVEKMVYKDSIQMLLQGQSK